MKITKEKYEEILKCVSIAHRCSLGGTSEYVLFNVEDGNVWVSHRPISYYNGVQRSSCILIADFGNGLLIDGYEIVKPEPLHEYVDYQTIIKYYRFDISVDWDDPNYMYTSAYRVACEQKLENGGWEEIYRDWVDSALKDHNIEVE